jgi:hypothetical protein
MAAAATTYECGVSSSKCFLCLEKDVNHIGSSISTCCPGILLLPVLLLGATCATGLTHPSHDPIQSVMAMAAGQHRVTCDVSSSMCPAICETSEQTAALAHAGYPRSTGAVYIQTSCTNLHS